MSLFFNLNCPHFNQCSGCTVVKALNKPPLYREVISFFKECKLIDFNLHAKEVEGWRMRAKLVVRGSTKEPKIGLYREGSHDVVDIPFCKAHHPIINKGVEIIRRFVKENQISPYQEKEGSGELRYLQLSVQRMTKKLQISLVVNKAKGVKVDWVESLKNYLFSQIDVHSIWLNYNQAKTNTIFGSDWHLVVGEAFFWETYGDTQVAFHPGVFMQAHTESFEALLNDLKCLIPENAKLIDYYSGVGVIGLSLIQKCQWLQLCEINPLAKQCFEKSIERLPLEFRKKVAFHCDMAASQYGLMQDAEIIIVDPPRKGLGSAFIQGIEKVETLTTIVYISCGWESFKRDCKELISKGWLLSYAKGYLFFPGCNHIEILALFKPNMLFGT